MTLLLAALISWTACVTTPNASDVKTEGRLLYALAPRSVTVNGVHFAPVESLSAVADRLVASVPLLRVTDVYWAGQDATGLGDAAYRTLLSDGFYSPRYNPKRFAITLRGLTEGRRYLVQFWFCDRRESRRKACQSVGGKTLAMSDGGCPFGAFAVGVFVASGADQPFVVDFNIEGQVNAIQVRDLDDDLRDIPLPPASPRPGWSAELERFNPTWTNSDLGTFVSSTLPTAALLGNGSLGLVNGGTNAVKRFVLTRGDLWSCGRLANGFSGDPRREVMPISFADLEIDAGSGATGYADTLDLGSATLETAGTLGGAAIRLSTFVAAEDDSIVVEGVSSRSAVWQVRLRAHDEIEAFPTESFVTDTGVGARRRTIDATGGDPRGWTTNATACLRVVGADVYRTFAPSSREAVAKVRLTAGQPFALVIRPSLDGVCDWQTVANLRRAHLDWWRDWWARSSVALGDAELERYYHGSLYLLGSGARKGKFPPGLYGPWQTTDSPLWHNDYHLNYNYIAPFFGCYAANRADAAQSLPEPIIAYLPRAVANARDSLSELDRILHKRPWHGVTYVRNRADLRRGIPDAALYPVGLGPWGVSSEGDDVFLNQTLNGPYQAAVFCTYWKYTLDRDYLLRVWPVLDKVANFYLAWCEREALPNGRYRYVLWDSWHEGRGLLKNCGQTLAPVRQIFETLVDAAPVLREQGIAVPDGKVARWSDFAENLSALPAGFARIDGRDVKIFSTVEPEDGRAVFCAGGGFELEPLVVGEAFSFDVTPEVRAVATNTVRAKLSCGAQACWSGINQTPKLFVTAIRAGYPAVEVIAAFKKHQLDRYGQKNFTLHDGYHGFEKIGAMEFVNSMLLQCDHGIAKVFPNWTGADASFVNLRAQGAFLVSSELRGGVVTKVRVTSEKGGIFRLVDPFEGRGVASEAFGRGKTRKSGEDTIECLMSVGETREWKRPIR